MRLGWLVATVVFGVSLFGCHDSYPLVPATLDADNPLTEQTMDPVQESDAGGEPVQCGDEQCEAGTTCCDAECGLCSLPDGSCPDEDCRAPEPGDECPADSCGEAPSGSCPDGEELTAACVADSDGECVWSIDECPRARCDSDADCGRDYYCRFDTGSCGVDGSTGECAALEGGSCDDRGPVCGCDGSDYDSECEAQSQGALVAFDGDCDSEECWVPPGSDCCYSDDQCGRGEICRAGSCDDGLVGRCATPVQAQEGDCFADFQCGFLEVCEGAFFCPCGESCDRPDQLGRCVSSFGGFGN